MDSLDTVTAEDDWFEPSTRKSKKKNTPKPNTTTTTTTTTSEPTTTNNHTLDTVEDVTPKLLSKKEKEKLRKQRQKQAEKAQEKKGVLTEFLDTITTTNASSLEKELEKEEESIQPKHVNVVNTTKSKKKPAGSGMTIALLQQMMAEQRAAEEAERLRLEQEQRLEEERIRLKEEEEKRKEEERIVKKEKERLRKEQLKKEGKLLTKAQKEKEFKNKQRLEQLLASGVIIPAMITTHPNNTKQEEEEEDLIVKNKSKKEPFLRQKKKSSLTPGPTTLTESLESNSSLNDPSLVTEFNSELNINQSSIPTLSSSSSSSSSFSSLPSKNNAKKNKFESTKPLTQESEKKPKSKKEPAVVVLAKEEQEKKKNELEQIEKVVEEDEEVKACWEDESDHEENMKSLKQVPKLKSAWDESSDEEEKRELTSKESKKISKSDKSGKLLPHDISINKSSSTSSPALKSEKSSEVKEKKKGKGGKNDIQLENDTLTTESIPSSIQTKDTSKKKSVSESNSSTTSTPPSATLSNTAKKSTPTTTTTTTKKPTTNTLTSASSSLVLRSPICCILGHVDTGKTKLLDKIRQTNVQDGEAGGITQQIGATYFPVEAIQQKIQVLENTLEIKVPGLLIIDTPGHESFTNLRTRGSSLCNMAILVVDIMHGLEPQTLESLELLRQRKTPFIVALNKIDRLYDWKAIQNNSFVDSMQKQSKAVKAEFEKRLNEMIVAFAEQGLNARLYSENENMGKFVSIVPTSAITGEGIPDMLYLLIHLTQTRMSEKIKYVGELEATVLEVKVVEGLGTTIDVILSNGVLNESDTIVVCGLDGPIVTHIRALLTPQPMRELRVKSQYVHHKRIQAAMGVKISANGLEKAVAGSRLLVLNLGDDEEAMKEEIMADLENMLASVDKSGKGVWVQASTLGSLEALLSFLKTSDIPVAGMHIGPVHKKDVMKASIMLERAKEFAVMLCFDVKIDKDAQELAEEMGVKIFKADIIYHLFDQFTAYYQALVELRRKDAMPEAVFPCILKMVPGALFNKRDPIVLGVDVMEGVLRIGTPICVLNEERKPIHLGKVTSIEHNRKPLDLVKKGQASVAIKIECPSYEHPKMFGRHFNEKSEFYSFISRQSIDILKENFKHEMDREGWTLVIKLKNLFGII